MQLDLLSILIGAAGAVAIPWLNALPSRWQSEQQLHAAKLKDEFVGLRQRLEELHTLVLSADDIHRIDFIERLNAFDDEPRTMPGLKNLGYDKIGSLIDFYAPDLRKPFDACRYTDKTYSSAALSLPASDDASDFIECGDRLTHAILALATEIVEFHANATARYLAAPNPHPVFRLMVWASAVLKSHLSPS